MSIATQAQKTTQANEMSASATPTDNPLVMAFARYTSMVAGKPCTQATHPNGHITQANASLCAQGRAEEYLASLPQDTTQEEALAKLGEVQIFTIDRYMCLSAPAPADWQAGQALPQKCKFGHKTQAQALRCVGTQASPKAQAASLVKISMGGSLASHTMSLAEAEATVEASLTQAPAQAPEATQGQPEATQAPAKAKLKSGASGNTGRA